DDRRRNERAKAQGRRSPYWARLRAAALARDGGYCQIRLEGCTLIATSVHIAPALGGDHWLATLEDCLSACHHCHGSTDAPRAAAGRFAERWPGVGSLRAASLSPRVRAPGLRVVRNVWFTTFGRAARWPRRAQ